MLVSVIIVCHNDWPDLELSIQSALNQSYPKVQVIVVDNDSRDETPEVVPKIFKNQVVYIRQRNTGAAGGRNTGLKESRGELIQFLDGDDFLGPNKIEKQVKMILSNPDIDIVYGDFRSFRSQPDVECYPEVNLEDFQDIKSRLIENCLGPPHIFLFKKHLVEKVGFQDEDLFYEDWDYWLRAAFCGASFRHCKHAWSFYRRRSDQKSASPLTDFRARAQVLQKALTYVEQQPYRGQLLCCMALNQAWLSSKLLRHGQPLEARRVMRIAREMHPAVTPYFWYLPNLAATYFPPFRWVLNAGKGLLSSLMRPSLENFWRKRAWIAMKHDPKHL